MTGYQRLIDFDFDCNGDCGCFDIVVLKVDEANPVRREVIRSGRGEHKLLEVLGPPIQ